VNNGTNIQTIISIPNKTQIIFSIMKKIIDRLAEYIASKGISHHAFDISIKASNGYIGKQIKKRSSIGGDVIETIVCIYVDLNPDWLITGQGTMLRSSVPELASEGRLPVGGGVSPPVCVLCVAKDETIAALKAQIEVQSEYIGLLKEQCPPGSGQKRKQECA